MSSPSIRHARSISTTCVRPAFGGKAKVYTVRVQTAYKPVFPDYIDSAPEFRHGKPTPILPFFKEKSHTVPTKWSLYRPLIRATYARVGSSHAPHLQLESKVDADSLQTPDRADTLLDYPNIRRQLRLNWKKQRAQTSMLKTRQYLSTQYSLLSTLLRPSPSDLESLSSTETRLARRYAREDTIALRRANKRKPRPRLTGGLIYPSHFAPPLPRMKPQPAHWSGMIRSRIRARQRRMDTMRQQEEWLGDMIFEERFLRNLNGSTTEPGDESGMMGWKTMLAEKMARYRKLFAKDTQRSERKFTEDDMERILKAKKEHRRRHQAFREKRNEESKTMETKRREKLVIDKSQKKSIKIRKD